MLSDNALVLAKARYFLPGESTMEDLAKRVAQHADPSMGAKYKMYKEYIGKLIFVPSRMPYMGTDRPFSSSCFVLGPIEDSRESIFKVMTDMANVQAFGGGTGYDWSRLRPKGTPISTNRGKASGPISFMKLYNEVTKTILRAGNKSGAQMGILRCDHPDIEEFIYMKDEETDMYNFNVSVAITTEFIQAVLNKEPWDLKWDGKVYKTVAAEELWYKIARHAWTNGEPGVIFIDEINHHNKFDVPIEATNACSEQPLPPNSSCNLGSIDISKLITDDGEFDMIEFGWAVFTGIYFLNDSINNAWWPVDEIKQNTLKYRNIGLGIMGFADALIKMGIPYNSDKAVAFADRIASALKHDAEEAAKIYAKEHGTKINTTLTSIAPTGSISQLASCSFSIEPLFGLSYTRNTVMGAMTTEVHPLFKEYMVEHGFWNKDLEADIKAKGKLDWSMKIMDQLPKYVMDLFATANQIPWEQHLRIQAAFQKHIDSAVSKTVNLPESATVKDVSEVFFMAERLGCKSVTVYRNNSRKIQAIDEGAESKGALSELGFQMDMRTGDQLDDCPECTI